MLVIFDLKRVLMEVKVFLANDDSVVSEDISIGSFTIFGSP